jgi:hypothetical protein
VLLLSLAIEPWRSAMILAIVLLAIAGGLALTATEQTSESVREDVRYLKETTGR